jgi:hypothetical protein
MIRRDADGQWLLISQVDHARVAADIAALWGNSAVAGLPMPDELVPALRDHDAGWSIWERTPRIDPSTGLPRDFTEMRMDDSTDIWSRSILFCAGRSPLQGLWVSKHFCWLAESAREHRGGNRQDIAAVDAFLAAQETLQSQWWGEAATRFDGGELADLVENGFRCVQFFDRISLWLCCAERSQPWDVELPEQTGSVFRFTPRSSVDSTIDPYPLSCPQLDLSVQAKLIAAKRYSSDEELHGALSAAPAATVTWSLSS